LISSISFEISTVDFSYEVSGCSLASIVLNSIHTFSDLVKFKSYLK